MLLGLASYGENTQAQAWIDQFRTAKMENQLIPTFNRDLVGGGSREGTGYGTAMKNLLRALRLVGALHHASASPRARRTRWPRWPTLMHSIVPTLDRLAPTGDHARD